MPFATIDHTADIGIQVWAEDMPALLTEAALGMFWQITDLESIAPASSRAVHIDGVDETDLLICTLRELLYLFAGEGMVVKNLMVESLEGLVLNGRAEGEMFEPQKHSINNEIKAVTYAGGDIKKTVFGLEAVVIFDV